MKAMIFLAGLVLTTTTCLADPDYKQLTASKRDQPSIITTMEAARFPIPYGTVEIPKGTTVKLLAISPDGTLNIEYNGLRHSIPAANTDLEQRIADIRSRPSIVLNAERKSPAITTLTPLEIKSVAEILNRIPKDQIPLKAQGGFWNELQLTIVNKWLSENVVGKKMRITASFVSASPREGKIHIDFGGLQKVVANSLSIASENKGYSFFGTFSSEQEAAISKMINGQYYRFTGTIKQFSISSPSSNDSHDPHIATQVSFWLDDCQFDKQQPLSTPQRSSQIRKLSESPRDKNYKPLGQ